METLLMKGKPVADAYREAVSAKIAAAKEKGIKVTLAIIVVGDDPASHVYKDRLVKLVESLGGEAKVLAMPETATQEEVIAAIKKLNHNRYVTGILPIMATLSHYGIELKGKNVVVVGRSNVVGKPVALLLLQEHATVTVCHSRTRDIADVLRGADVIVAAVGVPAFIKPEMVKEGVVIVDVGINAVEGGLVGDVDPAVSAKAGAFTPVPGGIGIVSNMMVMDMLSRNL